MIKEIKFTDKALKQINVLLSKKIKALLESLSRVVDAQVFNTNLLLTKKKMMMI